jgi:single-strand DNA-binding protein
MTESNVQIIGNVGMRPDVKSKSGSKKVARFTLTQVSFRFLLGKEPIETNWFSLVAWDEQADIVEQYLYRGRRVGITGKLIKRVWYDHDGAQHSMSEVQVHDIVLMDDLQLAA